jgi:chromosome segregation ATPase
VKRRAFVFAVAAALALPVLAWSAEPIAIEPEARAAQKEMWQTRFRGARQAVAAARKRHTDALAAYKQMRHRNRERGEAKQQIQAELSASEAALDAAESALKALFESARRAGVPPGWTQMKRGEHPAAPEPTPDAVGQPQP